MIKINYKKLLEGLSNPEVIKILTNSKTVANSRIDSKRRSINAIYIGYDKTTNRFNNWDYFSTVDIKLMYYVANPQERVSKKYKMYLDTLNSDAVRVIYGRN